MSEEIADRLEHLRWLKERAAVSAKIAKERSARFKEYQADLFHYMRRNNLDGISSKGHTFALRSTDLGTVNDQEAFERWLKEQDLYEDYISTEPRKARVNELVRERLDAKQEMPPGVGAYANEYISITER